MEDTFTIVIGRQDALIIVTVVLCFLATVLMLMVLMLAVTAYRKRQQALRQIQEIRARQAQLMRRGGNLRGISPDKGGQNPYAGEGQKRPPAPAPIKVSEAGPAKSPASSKG